MNAKTALYLRFFIPTLAMIGTSLRLALRYLGILVVATLCLVALILASLPRGLFSSGDLPIVSIALVYGSEDSLGRNLSDELKQIEVIDRFYFCNSDEARSLLLNGEVDAFITLPDNMLENLVSGKKSTITVTANDPVLGAVVYAIVERAAKTANSLQSYMLAYKDAALSYYGNNDDAYNSINSFAISLMGDALSRLTSVSATTTVSPFYLQLLTLLLFVICSLAALFCALTISRQCATGFSRRLLVRKISFLPIVITQLTVGAILSIVLCLVCGLALNFVDQKFNLLAFMFSGLLLSQILVPLFALVAMSKPLQEGTNTRTLLAVMAMIFLLLFIGGGFYPSYLMQLPIRVFNPVWLANVLSSWTLGASLNLLANLSTVALFLLPFAIFLAGWYLQWRLLK
ncbi:MAG: ABC transporter permease [Coriobacteriales bacterium]|jgi:hypothetical protein|nr:ABC transporter permease [Coriobacteriales bacterium]